MLFMFCGSVFNEKVKGFSEEVKRLVSKLQHFKVLLMYTSRAPRGFQFGAPILMCSVVYIRD